MQLNKNTYFFHREFLVLETGSTETIDNLYHEFKTPSFDTLKILED